MASSRSDSANASSFLEAMGHLNQQHPPTQTGSTSYAPLVPNHMSTMQPAGTGASSSSNIASKSSDASSSSTLPQNYANSRQERAAQMAAITAKRFRNLIGGWKPRELTPEAREKHLRGTRKMVDGLVKLLTRKQELGSARDINLETALYLAHMDYMILFPRAFRINDLPTEILANILRFVSSASPAATQNLCSRIRLSLVSRHWRAVMISDTTLWNSIWFRNRAHDERAFVFFERAGFGPIDIRIDDEPENPFTVEAMATIVNKLFVKLSCIRILVVVVRNWGPINAIFEGLCRAHTEKLPMIMHRLEFHRNGTPFVDDAPNHKAISLFGGAHLPSFRWLSLNGVHIDWKTSAISKLETLDLRRIALQRMPSLTIFRAILNECPALQKLILDGAGPDWDIKSVGLSPIEIPSLKILVMGGFSDTYATYVISQFTCVNVIDLTLMNLVSNESENFISAMTSKTPKVRILSLFNLTLPPTLDTPLRPETRMVFKAWLKSMPDLTILRCGRTPPNIYDVFTVDLEALRPTTDMPQMTPLICPKLAYFDLHFHYSDKMADWVTFRRQTGRPLKKVYMIEQFAKEMTDAQHKTLKDALGIFGELETNPTAVKLPEELALMSSD